MNAPNAAKHLLSFFAKSLLFVSLLCWHCRSHCRYRCCCFFFLFLDVSACDTVARTFFSSLCLCAGDVTCVCGSWIKTERNKYILYFPFRIGNDVTVSSERNRQHYLQHATLTHMPYDFVSNLLHIVLLETANSLRYAE